MLITSLLLSSFMGISYPLISEYIYSITYSAIAVGFLSSLRSIFGIFFLILGGFLADSIGRRKPIWIGTIMLGFSHIIYAISNDMGWLILAVILEGFSFFYFPAFSAMIMDSTRGNELMRIFTLVLIVDHLPYSLTPIFGGIIRDSYGIVGLRICFMVSGALMIIIGIIRWKLLLETLIETRSLHAKMLIEPYIKILNNLRELNPLIVKIIALRAFILLSAISMFYSFSIIYAIRYAKVVSFTEWGFVLAISSLFYLAVLPLTKFLKKSFYPSILFCEGISIAVFLIGTKISILISMILMNIMGAITYSIERTILAETTKQSMRGRGETFMNLSFYFGSFIGGILGGFIYSINPPLLLMSSSMLLIFGSILAFILFRKYLQ
ncbi:MAG: MFS transporter [Candidatus Methanomethyliaceae archaeon]|nr:MFS transporter [Candidatus Methanomethyliaceae archaeon]MDW7970526.1 MFS transporter [Nitrososphaerota archaeon]